MTTTFHHYGAAVLDVPIAQLHFNIQPILHIPIDLVGAAGHASAVLEESRDGGASKHKLIYRSAVCAAEIAEYVATCTLRPVADAPHTTLFEWTRAYRPAASADHDQIGPFVGTPAEQDQAIAAQLSAKYGGAEVVYIDYTLGDAISAAHSCDAE